MVSARASASASVHPPPKSNPRISREVTAAQLAAAIETPKVISRKSSLDNVASSVPPSPRLTNFPIREQETPRPTLSRLSSLRNLTKQKEIARQAEKKKKEDEEKKVEEERAHRRKEKQERSEKRERRKEKDRSNGKFQVINYLLLIIYFFIFFSRSFTCSSSKCVLLAIQHRVPTIHE